MAPTKAILGATMAFGLVCGSPAPAQDFTPIISHAIDQVIVPGFERFQRTSVTMAGSVRAYCAKPDGDTREELEGDFRAMIDAFGHIEPFKFGPARENNRFERLFFWPDRRGRGLRQVRNRISAKDSSVLDVSTLRQKSVAVQGLLSLEYVLTKLTTDQKAADKTFLCGYAKANIAAIQRTAGNLLAGWSGPNGYGTVMRSAGADNPIYKSDKEVVQELFRSAKEQLLVVKDMKLLAVLGRSPEKSKPKRAPFWRSGNSLVLITANLRSVKDLIVNPAVDAADKDGLRQEFLFEFSNAKKALNHPENPTGNFVQLLGDAEADARLRYAVHPIAGLTTIVGERYPASLGLTLGFNSLDGD